jgi:ribonuclease HII
MMARVGGHHPAFGMDRHVGYGTREHLAALKSHGPVAGLHRFTFSPIRER